MEIIRAKHMGFCFGVLEAINVCNSLVEEKGRKYILGMLVHNKQVVEDMQRKGFKLVTEDELLEDMDELKEGDIVSLDIVTELDGYYGDSAKTFAIGEIDEESKKLGDAVLMEYVANMPARVKCATLSWHSLRVITEKYEK